MNLAFPYEITILYYTVGIVHRSTNAECRSGSGSLFIIYFDLGSSVFLAAGPDTVGGSIFKLLR
jgi:hypothetical protein